MARLMAGLMAEPTAHAGPPLPLPAPGTATIGTKPFKTSAEHPCLTRHMAQCMNTVRPPTGAIEQSAVITNEPGPGPAVVPVAPQLVPPPQKERSVQRRRVLKSATIAFNQRFSSVPCVVHNLSSTAALLRIEGTITCPTPSMLCSTWTVWRPIARWCGGETSSPAPLPARSHAAGVSRITKNGQRGASPVCTIAQGMLADHRPKDEATQRILAQCVTPASIEAPRHASASSDASPHSRLPNDVGSRMREPHPLLKR
jgi:hypothetical protein